MKACIQSRSGMPRGMSQYTAWLGFKNMGFETSGLAGFLLPGMDGETPTFTKIESPKSDRVTKQVVRKSDLVDSNAVQFCDYVTKSNDWVIDPSNGKNVGNDVGNGGNGCR